MSITDNNFEYTQKTAEFIQNIPANFWTDLRRICQNVSKEKAERFEETITSLNNFVESLETSKRCPHCRAILLLSDLGEYDYVCSDCNESFYKIEI